IVTYRLHVATTTPPRTGVAATDDASKTPGAPPPSPALATRPATAPAATPETSGPITLRRVNGVWRIPVSQLAPDVDPAALEQRLAELQVLTTLVREVAGDIADGKFATAEQAADAWHSRFFQSLSPKPATRLK